MLGSQQAALWQHLRMSGINVHFDGYVISCIQIGMYNKKFALLSNVLISVTVSMIPSVDQLHD